jgi:hypothetical protein
VFIEDPPAGLDHLWVVAAQDDELVGVDDHADAEAVDSPADRGEVGGHVAREDALAERLVAHREQVGRHAVEADGAAGAEAQCPVQPL